MREKRKVVKGKEEGSEGRRVKVEEGVRRRVGR